MPSSRVDHIGGEVGSRRDDIDHERGVAPVAHADLVVDRTLCRHGKFYVASATRCEDGAPVLLADVQGYAPRDEIERSLQSDLALIREASGEVVAEQRERGAILLIQGRRVSTLSETLADAPLELARCFELLFGLVRFLAAAHARGTVLPGWPGCLLVDHDTGEVIAFPHTASMLKGAVSDVRFLPPEQLVMPQPEPDVAADLYGLGVTAYCGLTGRFPFTSESTHLIQEILAHPVTPPHTHRVDVPRSLSAIVEKLLAKSPLERYRTPSALLLDLLRSRANWQSGEADATFPLAVTDATGRLNSLPLLGRDRELREIEELCRSVRRGGVAVVSIRGAAGVGKSALIDALRSTVAGRCFFASGKFDQVHQGLVSGGLVAAMRTLLDALLLEDESTLAFTKRVLNAELGRAGPALVELLPNLASLLTFAHDEQATPSEAARNRLERAFVTLIGAIASLSPLVLFVDDLQWCDDASARLLAAAITRVRDASLLVIITHRPETREDHPLNVLLRQLKSSTPDGFTEMDLDPLPPETVAAVVDRVLLAPVANEQELTLALTSKSGGNPLYLKNLLQEVLDSGFLTYQRDTWCWVWDRERLSALDATENVITLLVHRFDSLEPRLQEVAQVAACLGSSFELDDLAAVSERDASAMRGVVERLCAAQFLLPASVDQTTGGSERYRFSHDRVHQVAYAAIPTRERARLHGKIARFLLSSGTSERLERELFKVVDHINLGAGGEDALEPAMRREWNLKAGQQALRGTAYSLAFDYLSRASEGLDESVWETHHEFAVALSQSRATASYLGGDTASAEHELRRVLEHSHDVAERAETYVLYLTTLMVAARYRDALDLAADALNELGVTLDDAPPGAARLDLSDIMRLAQAPTTEDPRVTAAARLLATMLPLTFLGDPSLFPAVVQRAVRLALDEGPTSESAMAIAAYGILLASRDEHRDAHACGQSALTLIQRFDALSQRCRTEQIYAACLAHWKAPLRESELVSNDAYEAGIDAGDLQYAAYTRLYDAVNRFHAAQPLRELKAFCEAARELPARTGDMVTSDVLTGTLRIIDDLLEGGTERLDHDADYLEACKNGGGELSCCIYLVMKAEVLLRRQRIDDCVDTLNRVEPLLVLAPGVFSNVVYVLLRGLCSARLAAGRPESEREHLITKAGAAKARLEAWAADCPENFLHKAKLIEAELLVAQGDELAAMRAYDEAIAGAEANGFVQEEIFAVQRCAQLCETVGLSNQALGLSGRLRELRERWGEFAESPMATASGTEGIESSLQYASPATLSGLSAAARVAQQIAESVELGEVLESFVTAAVRYCGAERAVLLLQHGESLEVARVHPARPDLDAAAISETAPAQVVRFVARTGQAVEWRHDQPAPRFVSDPYLTEHAPAALIAVPIVHGAQQLGVLYLENGHTSSAFSAGTREFLWMLGTRASFALVNAQLFEKLKQEVAQRRLMEDRLKSSLDEKEILLRELHHRVKNNLQVISSLLGLQIGRSNDEQVRRALLASRERIHTMALVHLQLYDQELASRLDLPSYIRKLALRLSQLHGRAGSLALDLCGSLNIGVSEAVPVGLLLNELLTNAFVHAFPHGEKGRVEVKLRTQGSTLAELWVEDDGVGLENAGQRDGHLGLRIAQVLAAQLGSELETMGGPGAKFRVVFDTHQH